jgi:uncharacterized membrane protein (DUF4010 family)
VRLFVEAAGSTVATIIGAAYVADTTVSAAARVKENDFAVSVDGAAVVTDVVGVLPTIDRVFFGANTALAGTVFLIKKVAFVTPAWSDVELVTESAVT